MKGSGGKGTCNNSQLYTLTEFQVKVHSACISVLHFTVTVGFSIMTRTHTQISVGRYSLLLSVNTKVGNLYRCQVRLCPQLFVGGLMSYLCIIVICVSLLIVMSNTS